MEEERDNMGTALMVDGNALAGTLRVIFGREMTTAVARCAGCSAERPMGALMAFTHGPGVVLRCPSCHAWIARIVETPTSTYLDVRGAAFVRIAAAS